MRRHDRTASAARVRRGTSRGQCMHPFRTCDLGRPCVIGFRCVLHYCPVHALRRCKGDHQRRKAGFPSQRERGQRSAASWANQSHINGCLNCRARPLVEPMGKSPGRTCPGCGNSAAPRCPALPSLGTAAKLQKHAMCCNTSNAQSRAPGAALRTLGGIAHSTPTLALRLQRPVHKVQNVQHRHDNQHVGVACVDE